ncbi:MAG: serine hydrolase [Maribacter sp.]|uniref:serine hydrolase n=1 Tax=Maribacter sp. TaxID=1897614 RepID=UPI003C75DA75
MYHKLFFSIFLLGLLVACEENPKSTNPLEVALASTDPNIKRVVDSLDQFEVQIKFTEIKRDQGRVLFEDYDFQVNDSNYFYPASTVKLPIAVLALEKLNQLDSLHRDTRFYIEGDSVETTFAADIIKIFAVSDNRANNRLFEFLGQDAINNALQHKGIDSVRISHRLSTDDAYVITTTPLVIYLNDSTTTMLEGTINTTVEPLKMNRIRKGIGFYEEDVLIHEPFDFALKNRYPINAQHGVMKRLIFPEAFKENERFYISKAQREFILEAMQKLPREAGYDAKEYYDSYVKFLMFGDSQEDIPDTIKIYNKVGYAYGTLTDCAYIHDEKNEVEFILTATVLVNSDGIFNDDTYDYDTIGIPFLAALGREIYTYELHKGGK